MVQKCGLNLILKMHENNSKNEAKTKMEFGLKKNKINNQK